MNPVSVSEFRLIRQPPPEDANGSNFVISHRLGRVSDYVSRKSVYFLGNNSLEADREIMAIAEFFFNEGLKAGAKDAGF
jgi:hypothetical protein